MRFLVVTAPQNVPCIWVALSSRKYCALQAAKNSYYSGVLDEVTRADCKNRDCNGCKNIEVLLLATLQEQRKNLCPTRERVHGHAGNRRMQGIPRDPARQLLLRRAQSFDLPKRLFFFLTTWNLHKSHPHLSISKNYC